MDTPEKAIIAEFIRRIDGALKGQPTNPAELLHERIVAQIVGTTPVSGLFPTRDALWGVAGQTVMERIKPETWSVRVLTMLGTGSRVAASLAIEGETQSAKRYNSRGWPTACIFGVRYKKINEIWLCPDTLEIETVIFGRRCIANS